MISPSYSLTATERVLPNMALDFTTAVLDSRVTLTRSGNTATVTNSSGVIAVINANLPRFDYNPTTLVCQGLLMEDSRTNLLLNSLIDGTSLATQLVTTTAAAHTLTFYGTGQIVLTGTSSATVVGTGAYPTRTTLTFTPTVGVLTLTVTGTVQYAQLEVGAFSTSFIPTGAAQVTRTADVAVMTSTNFSSWYNASQGAFVVESLSCAALGARFVSVTQTLSGATADNTIYMDAQANIRGVVFSGSTAVAVMAAGTRPARGTLTRASLAYAVNSYAVSLNGATPVTDSAGALPVVANTQLEIGQLANGLATTSINSHMRKISFWPQRLINAEVQAFTK
jgi:hypothetical protein